MILAIDPTKTYGNNLVKKLTYFFMLNIPKRTKTGDGKMMASKIVKILCGRIEVIRDFYFIILIVYFC